MNKLKVLTIFALIFTGLGAYGQTAPDEAGTVASAFLKIGAGSPRAQALGNAYVSLAEGADAMYWNPAGLAVSTTKEVEVAYLSWLQGYKARTLAYVQPLGKTVFGITGNYMNMDDFDWYDDNAHPIYDTDVRNYIVSASLARGFFGDVLQLGGTVKFISENNVGENYTNIGYDVGAKLKIGRFGLGAAAVNIGDEDEMPLGIRGGAHFGTKYWTLVGEVIKYNDYELQYGGGLEIHITEDLLQVARFDLRVGYYSREDTGTSDDDKFSKIGLDKTSKVSFGFGLYSGEVFGYGTSIDYSMIPFGALGTVYQVSVGIQF